jgi:ABC-type xylose transport system permease subunit
LAAWFAISLTLGLYAAPLSANLREWWRVPVAALFAGPLAALIRAFILGSVVIPIFALVLSGTTMLGMLLWRGLAWFIWGRGRR